MGWSKPGGKGTARQGSDGFWTLWVGNLPAAYSNKSLDDLFKDVGGGRHKKNYLGGACGSSSNDQWAKIFFDTKEEAERAIEKYDGVQIQWPPGEENARVHRLTLKWFDYDKAEDERFAELPFGVKMEATRKYLKYGVTGKRYSTDKGWTWDHPRIPGYVKEMVFQGMGQDDFDQLYKEQDLERKGKGKGKYMQEQARLDAFYTR